MKREHRSGVWFTCESCGKLLRDCEEHAATKAGGCLSCRGDLRVVGIGDARVSFAQWFRCLSCSRLFMLRRGELVETQPRTGFREFG